MSKSIAIITARGGSKRIPRKNIKSFCGKPIISYSIEAALKSNIFDEVMVSTDDEEIKATAVKYGAKVPFMRSDKASNDMTAIHEVLLEVIDEYKKQGQQFDYLCCIFPTAPFISIDNLKKAYTMLKQLDAEAVYPIMPFTFPPQRGVVIRNGIAEFIYPENMFVRSQELETIYHDCGQFYFLEVDSFLEQKKLILDKTIPIILCEIDAQDIDNEDDWKIAELKFQIRKGIKD